MLPIISSAHTYMSILDINESILCTLLCPLLFFPADILCDLHIGCISVFLVSARCPVRPATVYFASALRKRPGAELIIWVGCAHSRWCIYACTCTRSTPKRELPCHRILASLTWLDIPQSFPNSSFSHFTFLPTAREGPFLFTSKDALYGLAIQHILYKIKTSSGNGFLNERSKLHKLTVRPP